MQLEEQKRETDRVQSEGELEIDKVRVYVLVAKPQLLVAAITSACAVVGCKNQLYTYEYLHVPDLLVCHLPRLVHVLLNAWPVGYCTFNANCRTC